MLEIREIVREGEASAELVLPFDARQKSRLRAQLTDGREVGLFLPRGTVLRDGDRLRASNGSIVAVRAAPETVSTVRSNDALTLLRAAYHLGNRHVALQIGEGWMRYRHDHVLDAMVQGLGLEVSVEEAPFEPEGGAYGGHHHSHGHDHDHDHHHDHHHEGHE